MSKKVIFIGDSHILFYAQIFMSSEEFLKKWRQHENNEISRSGFLESKMLDKHIKLIWKIRKTAYSASRDYFDTVYDIYEAPGNDTNCVVFQFGTADMYGILRKNNYNGIEEVINKYLFSIKKFAGSRQIEPIVMIPIIHSNAAPEKEINRFNEHLIKVSNEMGIRILNPFDIMNNNFKSGPEDDIHLSREDAEKSLKYILSKI